MNTILLLQE